MQASITLFFALFLTFIPAQTRQASRIAIETRQDACSGLTDAECCAQSLELAGFRATGDQVPRAAKTPLRLSCASPELVVPEGACRSIALARGLGAKEVGTLCAPATLEKRCDAADGCKSCMHDLEKLRFSSSHRACYAVTYTTPVAASSSTLIIVPDAKQDAANGGVLIRKRRTIVQ